MNYRLKFALPLVCVAVTLQLVACQEPTPAITGRLRAPTALSSFRGCPETAPGCDVASEGHTLLVIASALDDALRLFDVDTRRFFQAANPLFPLSIPVGRYPVDLEIEPNHRFAFVLNQLSRSVSLVDLDSTKYFEVDTDADSCSSFCGTCSAEGSYLDERCRAGVSRVDLCGDNRLCEPDSLVVPAGLAGADPAWDPSLSLPVFVSLAGTGEVVELRFHYPDQPVAGLPQRLELVRRFYVGGQPGGLAVTADGRRLFVADRASSSIAVLDTESGTVERVEVGGQSSKVALTPDGSALYVLLPVAKQVAVVAAQSLVRIPASAPRAEARNPSDRENIQLDDVPRGITFTRGVPTVVFGEAGSGPRDYTTELLSQAELADIQEGQPEFAEHQVKTLAFVAQLDGTVVVLDAENHRGIDLQPFVGPSLTARPALTIGGTEIDEGELISCETNACPYPHLLGFQDAYSPPVDDAGQLLSCSGHGKLVTAGDGSFTCECEEGYVAIDRECVDEEIGELFRVYYGIYLRPGVTRTEGWLLTWEGVVSGAGGYEGTFSDWTLSDPRGLDFAALGVEPGDILEILSEPSGGGGGEGDDPCRAGRGDGEQERAQTEFEIISVGPGSLELQPVDGVDPAACFGGTVKYQVRVSGAWTVEGSKSGVMPRLRMVDPADLPLSRPAYDNGVIALTLVAPDAEGVELKRDSTIGFSVTSGFTRALFTPSVLSGGAGPITAVDLLEPEQQEPEDDRIYLLYTGSDAMLEFFPDNLDSGNYLFYQ